MAQKQYEHDSILAAKVPCQFESVVNIWLFDVESQNRPNLPFHARGYLGKAANQSLLAHNQLMYACLPNTRV